MRFALSKGGGARNWGWERKVLSGGAIIIEVPIIFYDRHYGKSKMSRAVIGEAVRTLFALWRKRLWGK